MLLSIGNLGLKEPHGKIGNPEMPMDNDKISLTKSLSSLANSNRKGKSGPLSKDKKTLDNNCFSAANDRKHWLYSHPYSKGWKTDAHLHKGFFFFFLNLFLIGG